MKRKTILLSLLALLMTACSEDVVYEGTSNVKASTVLRPVAVVTLEK